MVGEGVEGVGRWVGLIFLFSVFWVIGVLGGGWVGLGWADCVCVRGVL